MFGGRAGALTTKKKNLMLVVALVVALVVGW